MVNFPTSLDSLSNPTSSTFTDDTGFFLDVVISTLNDIAEALETKMGTGASTPVANSTFVGNGTGTSTWLAGLTAPYIAAGAVLKLLSEQTVTGSAVATVDFTNIAQTYRSLLLVGSTRATSGGANVLIRLSSDGTTFDTGSNYDYQNISASAASPAGSESFGGTSGFMGVGSALATTRSQFDALFHDYTDTTYHKTFRSTHGHKGANSTGGAINGSVSNWWRNTAAIKGIRLLMSTGNIDVGSKYSLYGLPL